MEPDAMIEAMVEYVMHNIAWLEDSAAQHPEQCVETLRVALREIYLRGGGDEE